MEREGRRREKEGKEGGGKRRIGIVEGKGEEGKEEGEKGYRRRWRTGEDRGMGENVCGKEGRKRVKDRGKRW